MTTYQIFQMTSVLVLATVLFFPVSKVIWVLSVRRLQRKLGRNLSQQEVAGQRQRANFIAVVLVLPFAWLFTINLLKGMHG